jgi:hypothetical protein
MGVVWVGAHLPGYDAAVAVRRTQVARHFWQRARGAVVPLGPRVRRVGAVVQPRDDVVINGDGHEPTKKWKGVRL